MYKNKIMNGNKKILGIEKESCISTMCSFTDDNLDLPHLDCILR